MNQNLLKTPMNKEDGIRLAAPEEGYFNVIDYRFRKNNTPKPIIVFLHGFKGFKDWGHFNVMADAFANAGFVFVKVNVSHNGTSPDAPTTFVDLDAFGNNTLSMEQRDFRATIDWLFSGKCSIPKGEMDLSQLFILGHSRGGGGVINYACADERVKGTCAMAPVHSYDSKWSEEGKKAWQQQGVIYVYNGRTKQNMPLSYDTVLDYYANIDQLEVLKSAKNCPSPILIIHGDADETLAVEHLEDFKFNNPLSKKMIIEGANHVFGGKHPYEGNTLPEHTELLKNYATQFFMAIAEK
ncbi:alpha/beta hydrolase family protein [Persicobacter psychrovividus]|uniref:AB hydrolase-1 domain-containing protein n=1 Tax=Persicobacter psychrovividus TaxID=387638 RepID=A0ABM7VER8_9BACT|nr:hypothetical protein PEPS_17080 [Persicobacter psychrovividus]